jgi:hypothetical protein
MYFLGCRGDWLAQWADGDEGTVSAETTKSSPEVMARTLDRMSALVENVCIHLLSKALGQRTKSLAVVEIPQEKRNPDYKRRFEVVLAAEGVIPWTMEYKASGFNEQ